MQGDEDASAEMGERRGRGAGRRWSHLFELGDGLVHPLDVLLDRVLPADAKEALAARQRPWLDHARRRFPAPDCGAAPCGPLAVGPVAFGRLRNAAHGIVRLGGHRERVRGQVGGRHQLPQDVHPPAAQLQRAPKARLGSGSTRPEVSAGARCAVNARYLPRRTAGLRQWPFTKVGTACRASARSRSSSCGDAIFGLTSQLAEPTARFPASLRGTRWCRWRPTRPPRHRGAPTQQGRASRGGVRQGVRH